MSVTEFIFELRVTLTWLARCFLSCTTWTAWSDGALHLLTLPSAGPGTTNIDAYRQFGHQTIPTQWIQGKVVNLEKHGFGSLHNVAWTFYHNDTSCFDTDFFSQIEID